MAKSILNGNKWNVVIFGISIVFAAALVFFLANNNSSRISTTTVKVDKLCNDVLVLQTDVKYIKEGIDRIEGKLK